MHAHHYLSSHRQVSQLCPHTPTFLLTIRSVNFACPPLPFYSPSVQSTLHVHPYLSTHRQVSQLCPLTFLLTVRSVNSAHLTFLLTVRSVSSAHLTFLLTVISMPGQSNMPPTPSSSRLFPFFLIANHHSCVNQTSICFPLVAPFPVFDILNNMRDTDTILAVNGKYINSS